MHSHTDHSFLSKIPATVDPFFRSRKRFIEGYTTSA